MTLDKDTIAVLRPVVEYARSELSDMEPDDVPVGLRKAAKSSARTLPPPIARSVVRELIDSERFRSAVRDRFDSGGTTDADLAAFLDDPQIGLERIASRVDASNDRKAENDLATANRKIVLLTGQLEEAKARMRAARADHLDALGAARNSVSEGHQRAEARNTELRKVVSAQTSEIDDLNRYPLLFEATCYIHGHEDHHHAHQSVSTP